MAKSNSMNLYTFKDDAIAGLVVFLIAVPLSLGIALASGAPLFSGVIAAIIGGIIVGALSSSAVSVSGPAAGMAAVVLSSTAALGSFEAFLLALTVAGILQIIAGSLRAGFIADYIPSNVIQGLLCAIGILIILKQIPIAFTHVDKFSELKESLAEASNHITLAPLISLPAHINWGATIISVLSFVILISADHAKSKVLKFLPAPIIVVILGVVLNEIYLLFFPHLFQDSVQLVNIPNGRDLHELMTYFRFPDVSKIFTPNIYFYSIIIAAVASLETLLNIEAAEKLDPKRRYTSPSRELMAQGVGNIVSGLLGGLPITSVIVRTSVNINSGNKTRLATILHGTFFLVALLLIPHWLNSIPLASLAAILIYVGYKLSKFSIYKDMYRQGFEQYFPFVVTIVAIVFTNLLLGIIIGLLISIFFILKKNSQMRLDIIKEKHPAGIVQRIILPHQITFLNKASLVAELNSIEPYSMLVIDARYMKYLDKDIMGLIKDFAKNIAPDKKIELNLIGFKEHYDIHDHINFISVTTYDVQALLSPKEILYILKEGNQRFVHDQRINRYLPMEVRASAKTQHPLAIVLSCIDSRVPVETIFDVGMGDLFCARIAGNVVNADVIGCLEFAIDKAAAKVVLVMGHTRCGAIAAACSSHEEAGHIHQLLEKIQPAIKQEKNRDPRDVIDETFLTNVTINNIENSIKIIYESSDIIRKLVDEKTIAIVGAIYDIESGIVTFSEEFQEDNDVTAQRGM